MTPPGRRLLLIGGGHAQLHVLEALARRRIAADEVLLVAPRAEEPYAGMVPGFIEDRYTLGQLTLNLGALARAAGAQFIQDSVIRIDSGRRSVTLAGGRTLEYDVASIAISGGPAGLATPGLGSHAQFLTPIDRTARLVEAMEEAARNAGPEPLQVVVIGTGATGIEIALSTRARLDRLGANRAIITLLDAASALLRQEGPAASEAGEAALRGGEVTLRLSTGIEEIGPAHVRATGGRVIPADLIIWCAGNDAPGLFRDSGLPVDHRGFLSVDDTLAVTGITGLYGAGDAVSLHGAPRLTPPGVHAERHGAVLAENISVALTGNSPGRRIMPGSRSLTLINTGAGRAILSYSGLVTTTRWAMRLKDQLDRRFVRRFQRLYS
jgi:selenide,water dikinase